MANKLPLLFVLVVALSPAIGYICSKDENSPMDDFEAHGCLCGTETLVNRNNTGLNHVFSVYKRAFEGCHEISGVDVTIECAYLESHAKILKDEFNRTPLSEIPVIENQEQVYGEVTCL